MTSASLKALPSIIIFTDGAMILLLPEMGITSGESFVMSEESDPTEQKGSSIAENVVVSEFPLLALSLPIALGIGGLSSETPAGDVSCATGICAEPKGTARSQRPASNRNRRRIPRSANACDICVVDVSSLWLKDHAVPWASVVGLLYDALKVLR
jgi:hypothetical protein